VTSTRPGGAPGADPVRAPGPVARVLVSAVGLYRTWISPMLPPSCRFEPSCSAYAAEALTVHGALKGSWLALLRLLRCGPWHPGGYDPVPPRDLTALRARDPGHTVLHRDRVRQTPAEE
jgi:uncharacterized protein